MKPGLLFLLLCFAMLSLLGQNLAFKHYTVADNLPSNICYRIIQDEKGFIWVATEKGIAQFDGYRFKPLYTKNKLLDLDIWGLFKDDDNRIWLKSKQKQYIYFYKDSIYNINENQKNEDRFIAMINYGSKPIIVKEKENDPFVYILNEQQKLIKMEIPSFLKQRLLSSFKNEDIIYFNLSENSLVLGYDGEILDYDFRTKQSENRIFQTTLKAILHSKGVTEKSSNRFYFSANDSIFSISNNRIKFITNHLNKRLKSGSVFVGASNQVYFFRQGNSIYALDSMFNEVQFTMPNIEATISQIFEDNEGNLWFVTVGNGVYFVSTKTLANKIFTKENGLLENHILSLCMSKDKSVYLGYYSQDGFQSIKDNKLITVPKNSGIASSMVNLDKDDFLLTDQYISRDPLSVKMNFELRHFSQNMQQGYHITQFYLGVKSIYKLNETTALLGARNHLLKLSKIENSLQIDSLTSTQTNIYAIASIDQKIYIGTPDGLYSYYENQLKYEGNSHTFLQGNIRAILVDKEKKIWITSDNGNLNCFDKSLKLLANFSEIKGLVTSLSFDSSNHTILASSSNGLYVISIQYPYVTKHFTAADGLPSNEVNATISDTNYLYVATSSGLGILKKEVMSASLPSKIYCTKMYVNNKEKQILPFEELDYLQNNIRIELAALSYQSLGKINYYYRFKNLNDSWTITNQPQIEFSSLKPGKYELEIFAKDVNNINTANTLIIPFSIVPPFWKSNWFYILITFLFIGVFVSAIYYWLQRSKRKALQEMNLKKQFAEIKLNALQSQLNSHFIYNSLNAIQSFVLNKDEITASEYMNKFAKLIRLFLESSRSKYAPLQKEIEMITLYTQLEKLRFDDKFDVYIETDKITDLRIQFPTNMIQPFVENAIIHGLLHLPSKGKLSISFYETDNELCCTIEDNGIGRKKSFELHNSNKRKSFGLDIIQDKITNFDNLSDKQLSVVIIDKHESTHTSSGTIVNIRFKK